LIGVLALQGAFAAHARLLASLGHDALEVRTPRDLGRCQALVLPGGESPVQLRLLAAGARDDQDGGLWDALQRFEGPLLGTCAGLILLAKSVEPAQRSLGLLDVDVRRNGYGRQRDSFEDEEGRIFIRAPRITRVGPDVQVLASRGGEATLVRQGRILAATFHPELSGDGSLHQLLIDGIPGSGAYSCETTESATRSWNPRCSGWSKTPRKPSPSGVAETT
jgi:5'-phosphate synthase pdxT subunit